MANPRKREGTENENATKEWLLDACSFDVVIHLKEEGLHDIGDLLGRDRNGDWWVVECRQRQSMSVHTAYAKAQEKVQRAIDNGRLERYGCQVVMGVVLQWKRLQKKEGNVRRSQVGPVLFITDGKAMAALLSTEVR